MTILGPARAIPAPWINVIANPGFGFQVAVEGSGYTWSLGSRENQLTPWSNDPVTDRPGEVLYVRDEDSGELWGPTAVPIRHEAAPYVARHGQGYSRFEHTAHGIALDLLQYVPLEDPVKLSRLTIRNLSAHTRRLSVTAYVEWVLGPSRSASALSVVTEMDPETGAMFARNPWNTTFGTRVAFADLGGRQTAWTGDRREFLGRNGTLDNPAALAGDTPLSQRVGAGLDPCGALQAPVELKPGGTVEVVFLLGQSATAADAQALIDRYRVADLDAVLREVVAYWDEVLGTVQVKTPDRSMDLMLNRWLLYQTLACRVWARSAFYQASGAYGFRDQLQDGMALALSRPALTRAHLLRAAARQFVEGDVQHWWLPPSGQGVRTRISDDRIWLAYAAAHYVETTGDAAVLDEPVPFLEGQALRPGDHDAYFRPMVADESGHLFEHCARGLDQSLDVGAHGLPLIGTGDWNDGMNRVGEQGKGESVWLGWFLHATLAAFAPLAKARGEEARGAKWLAHAALLRERARARRLGRRLVPARLLRRRHAARLVRERRMPDRLDRAILERDLGGGGAGACSACNGRHGRAAHPSRRRSGGAVHAAVRSHAARPRIHQRLSAGYPGERRPVHPRGRLVGDRLRGAGRRRQGRRAVLAPEPDQPHEHAGGCAALQGRALRRRRRCLLGRAARRARWMDLVYGLGRMAVPGRARGDPRFSPAGRVLCLAPCIPKAWPGFEIVFKYRSARYEIAVENPDGVSRGVAHAELDGRTLPDGATRVPLVDDGQVHKVRVILG